MRLFAKFEADAERRAIVLFGEPGTRNEQEVAELVGAGKVRKPIMALIAGAFQERHPSGVSFGHAAAMITDGEDSASAKWLVLAEAGMHVAETLEDIVILLRGYDKC